MKILIVKLSSIGDIVHTLPAFSAIRREIPGAHVSWAVEKGSAEILRGNPLIDNLIEVDTRSLRGGRVIEDILPEAGRQLRQVRRLRFDVALDYQGLFKSAVIAKLSRAPRRFGFSRRDLREPASRFLLTDTIEVPPRTHIIRKNLLLTAGALSIADRPEKLEFPIFTGEEHGLEAEKIAAEAGESFAILNPAGGWATKLWPAEKFGVLADLLWEDMGLASIVSTAPNEDQLAQKVIQSSRSGRVFPARLSLKGFYELARRARIYVGGDTGPTHLAVAAGAPVVGLFGPTEWWRNGSPDPRDICVERSDIGCRIDCHRRTCSNWICMDILVDTVYHAVRKRLGQI